MKRTFPAALLLLLLAASCHSSRKAATEVRVLDGLTVSARNNPMDIYRESPPRTWDILHERVALSFNYADRTAAGEVWIDLQPYCCTQDSLVLDAKSMRIDSVAWLEDGKWRAVPFSYGQDQLLVRKRAARGTTPEKLYIRYIAMPYADTAQGGSTAISEARGLYFINTDRSIPGKPVQIWTQGETESNSHWLPTIDKPNERITAELELTVPDSFQTLSNGIMAGSRPAGKGLRTDRWRIGQPTQVYALMFAIGRYSIVRDSWNGKEVSYYVEPAYAPYARDIFRHTPEMLTLFSGITGVPYPWEKYAQIIARDYVSGAMENTSASLFGEFMNQNKRETEDRSNEDVVSHELFHQWFGDYVTPESWSNLTLSESFANYGEQLWRQHRYGAASADELAADDLNRYLNASESADPELVRFHYRDREDMFDRISYQKGGAILRYLHGLAGDTLFCRSMQLYLTRHALQSAEAPQWRIAVEEATGRDWHWFFDQWYYRAGHPVLDIRYQYDDAAQQLKVTVRQRNLPDSNRLYHLPLKTGVLYGSERTIVDWDLKLRTETFTYPYHGGIRPVIVPDIAHWLPGVIREDKRPAEWLVQLRGTADYISKRRALAAASDNYSDPASKTLAAEALEDTIAAVRLRALGLLAGRPLQETLLQRVRYLALQDRSNRVRAAAFSCLGAWKDASARREMEEAVTDRSYEVGGAALQALYQVDTPGAYKAARAMMDTDPKGALEEAVWSIVAETGADSDLHVFDARVDEVYGNRRIQLADRLSRYIAHVQNSAGFERGLALLDRLFHAERIRPYRLSILSAVMGNLSDLKAADAQHAAVISGRREQARRLLATWIDTIPENSIYKAELDRAFAP